MSIVTGSGFFQVTFGEDGLRLGECAAFHERVDQHGHGEWRLLRRVHVVQAECGARVGLGVQQVARVQGGVRAEHGEVAELGGVTVVAGRRH